MKRNEEITNAIIEHIDSMMVENDGSFDIDLEFDDNTFVAVEGYYETDGYMEDDYFNGTGGYITTKCYVKIENWCVTTFDEDGDREIENDIDIDVSYIEKYFRDRKY